MRYVKEPWKNRVLGDGWSHNPWKRAAGMTHDPDIRATEIAEKYIGLITEQFRRVGLLPLMAAEVNFAVHGIKPENFLDYVNRETETARKRLGNHEAERLEKMRRELADVPVLLNGPCVPEHITHATASDPQSMSASAEQESKVFPLADHFLSKATRLAHPGAPDFQLIHWFLNPLPIVKHIQEKSDVKFNPEFIARAQEYAHALERMYITKPSHGALGRVYTDDFTNPGAPDALEIATPPRAPLLTIRQVNKIKQLLMESTYRFHGDPKISPLARRTHEALGDFDVSFIDPGLYSNLAEQVSFSLQTLKDLPKEVPTDQAYRQIVHSSEFSKNNFMNHHGVSELMATVMAALLPRERILSIGNRFPYDEVAQRNADAHHIRYKRKGRVHGRIEICDYHDATSNLSLTALGILATSFATFETIALLGEGGVKKMTAAEVIDKLQEMYPNPGFPRSPGKARAHFSDGLTINGMYQLGMLDAMTHGASEEDAHDRVFAELKEFVQCLDRRQQLSLARPWGGKVRAAKERANGWQIANPIEKAEEITIGSVNEEMQRMRDAAVERPISEKTKTGPHQRVKITGAESADRGAVRR